MWGGSANFHQALRLFFGSFPSSLKQTCKKSRPTSGGKFSGYGKILIIQFWRFIISPFEKNFTIQGIPLLQNVEINHFPIGGTKVTPNGEVSLFYLWETPHFPHPRSSFFPHLGNLISPKKGEKGRVTLF